MIDFEQKLLRGAMVAGIFLTTGCGTPAQLVFHGDNFEILQASEHTFSISGNGWNSIERRNNQIEGESLLKERCGIERLITDPREYNRVYVVPISDCSSRLSQANNEKTKT